MPRKYKRLRYEDRIKLEALLMEGEKIEKIAETLGVHRTTIYKEFKRSGTNELTYTADVAQETL